MAIIFFILTTNNFIVSNESLIQHVKAQRKLRKGGKKVAVDAAHKKSRYKTQNETIIQFDQ